MKKNTTVMDQRCKRYNRIEECKTPVRYKVKRRTGKNESFKSCSDDTLISTN